METAMSAIILSAATYYLILLMIIRALKPVRAPVLAFSIGYFLLITGLAVVNYDLGFVEQKFASEFAYLEYSGRPNAFTGNFAFQGYFNALGFLMTDRWEATIGINVAVFSALVLLLDRVNYIYLTIFMAPAVIHIEIVALRDVLVAATMLFLCLILLAEKYRTSHRVLLATPLLAILLLQRPELVGIFVLTFGVIYFLEASVLTRLLLGLFSLIFLLFVLPKATVLMGLPPTSSITEFIDTIIRFAEIRADRWVGTEGANSAMMGGAITKIPLLLRYPLQVFLFVFSPLPTDFRGIMHLIIAVDSLFFLAVLSMFWRRSNRLHKIMLLAYIMTMAIFMANYGNLFRMRMPCYFIMLSGIMVYYAGRARAVQQSQLRRAA